MKQHFLATAATAALACVLATGAVGADDVPNDSGIAFKDLAKDPASGLAYRRAASATKAQWDELRKRGELRGVTSPELFALYPPKPFGAPGVAVFDYDNDGDLDVFVTNGPGRANSLFRNQLKETGSLKFVDVAADVGLTMTAQDKTGVCFGDIDNDGFQDLYVLVTGGPNKLFRNRGNGRFVDITELSRTGVGPYHPTSCAFGDVNNDGLIDIAVANSWNDWSHRLPLASFNFLQHAEPNFLLVNKNGLVFEDWSERSGIRTYNGLSWAIAFVDYDGDGNLDLFVADDQAMKRPTRWGGEDEGKLRLYKGDGTGRFKDLTDDAGATAIAGDFMGIVFADFNTDGATDVFTTNMGNYGGRVQAVIPMVRWPDPSHHNELASRWYLGTKEGRFTDPGVGSLGTSPFGWGISAFDYDNDGCTDVVFYGALNLGIYYDASNPGALLRGNCRGGFAWDEKALQTSSNHSRRAVEGLATGDLNDDGFPDIVSASGADWPDKFPLIPYPLGGNLGGVFDKRAFIWPTFTLIDPRDRSKGVRYTGMDPVEGSLAVEMNGGNDNSWAKINLLGGKDLIPDGRVNRSGIGANLHFTPEGGRTVMRSVPGGGGYASNDALESIFGLGKAKSGRLDVLWTGAVLNRVYGVRAGERLRVPEIPCDIRGRTKGAQNAADYERCVTRALQQYVARQQIDAPFAQRLKDSAMRAWREARRGSTVAAAAPAR